MKSAATPTLVDIVVYVLAGLRGAERNVYSEDIAARSYELAPSRFSWRRPEYRLKGWPDKYVVKTALEDAKKPEYGALVDGVYALDPSKDGWRLTPEGARWHRDNCDRIEAALNVKQSATPRKDADRFKRRLREAPLFREFLKARRVESSSVYAFTDMLNCSPDASPEVVATKFQSIKAMAVLVQDPAISEFVAACAASFPQFSSSPKREANKESER
jgi:hypothetical protein